jgi:hypothetical protein
MTANSNRKRGKRNESALANRLGGDRVGLWGGEDIKLGPFSVEAKSRKKFAITKFMDQAVSNCPTDKTPLLILHTHNQRRDRDMVVMRLSDWEQWYGLSVTMEDNL